MKTIQKNAKCILLSDKASLLKLGTVESNYMTFWKRQNMERVKLSVVATDSGEIKKEG